MDDAPDLARVGVVIVNYRTLPELRACVDQAALNGVGQVVLVDNASDPAEITELAATRGFTAVLRPDNGGFAVGVNAGVAALGSTIDVVWLLNPDVTVEDDLPASLLGHLRAGWDGVAPNLVEPGGRGQVGAAGGRVSVGGFAAYFLFLSHVVRSWQGVFLTRSQARVDQRVAWLCMATPFLRRDAFDRFGAVPEDELVYAEDIAWGTAASGRSARFFLVGSVSAVHAHGASGASDRWIGALERLARRRLGVVRGGLAVLSLRLGIAVRRAALKRSITSRPEASPPRTRGR